MKVRVEAEVEDEGCGMKGEERGERSRVGRN